MARMLFEGLLAFTPEGRMAPAVATSWEVSEDATRFTFHLRPEARWSDGVGVTAGDFVFAWRRVLDPALGAESAPELYAIRGARAINEGRAEPASLGVRAESETVLVVELESADPTFLSRTALPPYFPVPAHVVGPIFLDWPGAEIPVGNGPFVLTRWRSGDRLEVTRSETYWNRAAIALEGVVLYPIEDGAAVMNLYRTGKLDWAMAGTTPFDQVRMMIPDNPAELHIRSAHAIYYLEVNTVRHPTDDPRVRRALELTVPRDEIASYIFGVGQRPSRWFVNPDLADWSPPDIPPGDAEEARRLLTAAGYPGGEGFPRIEYLYSELGPHPAVAEYLQGVWSRELGITVELVLIDFASQLERIAQGGFHLSRSGWLADLPDPYDFLKIFQTGNENNPTGWSDRTYDSLLRRSRSETDRSRRYALLREAEGRLLASAAVIPILHNSTVQLIKPYVAGIHPNPIDVYSWAGIHIRRDWLRP